MGPGALDLDHSNKMPMRVGQRIESKLEAAFSPHTLEVTDESHLHAPTCLYG